MKKFAITIVALFILAVVLPFCHSSKKMAAAKKTNYTTDVAPLMSMNCTPCHFPPKGNKLPLNSYAAVSSNIDDILERIQKDPLEKGFMPFKHPKLSDSTIAVFQQWKNDGLIEN
jgi:hypothetical protein